MSRGIYGNKMFVADLIIASLWGLFAAKSTLFIESWGFLAILMRIALCFRMHALSEWMGYSAMIFAGAYFMLPNNFAFGFQHAVSEIMFYSLHIIDWNIANEVFLHTDTTGFNICFYAIWILLSAWLVLMPLAVAIYYKKMFKFPKWCWVAVVLFLPTVLTGMGDYSTIGYFIFVVCFLTTCLLPEFYWIVRYGSKESLAAVLTDNLPLMYYIAFVSLFLAALILGFRNVYILKFISFVAFPAIFYVILSKSVGLRDIPTYDTLMMSICGILYWYSTDLGQTSKIILLIVAVIICLVVSIRLVCLSSNRFLGVALFIGVTAVLCPVLYGMNPYAVTNARHTRLYMKKPGACNGLYVTDNHNGVYGLRSRYGEILPMRYTNIDVLDESRDNILCCREQMAKDDSGNISGYRYTFFNINRRDFIKIPGNRLITKVMSVRKGVYVLYDNTGTPCFYLIMPFTEGIGTYQADEQVIPYS